MSEPQVTRVGPDGITGVYIDNVRVEDHDAQSVLRIQDLHERGAIPRHDYMKYIRRLKERAESSEV